jgi:hypothetical protein
VDVVAVEEVHFAAREPFFEESPSFFSPKEGGLGIGALFPFCPKVEEKSPLGELFRREVADRERFIEKLRHLFQIEADWIIDCPGDIGQSDQLGRIRIELIEVEDFVARDISIRASGNLDGEGIFFGVDP